MKLIAGLDIGNGYVKARVRGEQVTDIDIPSCMVRVVTNDYDIKPSTPEEEALVMANIYDKMDLSFESPLIPETGRFWFGRRAVQSDRTPHEFDINAVQKKFRQSLTTMLTFGSLAAKALDEYYAEHRALPNEPIQVEVYAAVALPIGEYKQYHEEFATKYLGGVHIVHVNNFSRPVDIVLNFQNVKTTAEGASAQYGISLHGETLVKAMLADVRSHGIPLEGYEPKHVINAKGILGVDIGEGTVNFPVFTNGQFNTDVSATLNKGYGEVIDRALRKLRDRGRTFNSRKELTEYLNNVKFSELPLVRQKEFKSIVSVVDSEITGFVEEITTMFGTIVARINNQLDVIYVYGGGATSVKNELYDQMLDAIRAVSEGEVPVPVLYLDSWYSRYLNRDGLYALAESAATEGSVKG